MFSCKISIWYSRERARQKFANFLPLRKILQIFYLRATRSPATTDPCACIGNQGVSDGSKFGADIGNSCDAWDGKEQYCIDYAAASKLDGGANDWCPAKFGLTGG